MDKKQAADFLGISTRTLERYTTQGKIGVTYRQGKTAAEAIYDDEELRLFKESLENKTFPVKPAVESENGVQALVATARATGLTEAVGSFRNDLIAALEALKPNGSSAPAVPIADKVMLTLPEAAALASLSRGHLQQAIHAGELKARIIGRGWKVKRTDFDAYVKRL